ncbi:MAG TPA: AI-2E family transporter [Candidatus Sulfotelmatobacter sp.]|nr:AI-2E family transporter [Candidatus Sulfotelmatobacter sp.]
MAIFDHRTARILTTILVFALVLAIVYVARSVVIIFVFSILFAYLIDPFVRFLQRHSLFFRNLRGPHILEAYLAFLILIAVSIHGVDPRFFRHAGNLIRDLPAVSDQIATGEIAAKIGDRYGWSDEQQSRLKSFLIQHHERIRAVVEDGQRIIPTAIGSLVLIPILALFFLSDGGFLAHSLIQMVSTKDNVAAVESFADELNVMFQHYIRAKVILGGLSFFYCSVGTLALGFPHWLALGVMAGVLEFIPVAGWMISAMTIVTIGALTHSHWIWMAALLGLWRMLMDYWISPRVVGHQLEIHPLLAIFTVMVGGAVGGIVGIYLSISVIATLRVVYHRLASPPPLAGVPDASSEQLTVSSSV